MRKFKIPAIPPTTQKSIRFPNDVIDEVEFAIRGTGANFSTFVIEEVEAAIRGTGATFSAFVVSATRWALEDLKEQEEEGGLGDSQKGRG